MKPFQFVRWILLVWFIWDASNAQSQGPYRLGNRDYAVLGLGAGMSLAGHIQGFRTPAPTDMFLDPAGIPRFERFVSKLWSEPAQKTSDFMVVGSGLAASSLLLNKQVRQSLFHVLVIGSEVMLLSNGLVALSKPMALRPRPYLYGTLAPLENRMKKDARFSFFSGHTTYASAFSFFTAKIIHDYYPDRDFRKWVWIGAAAIPAATGLLRVIGGKHFLTDVVVGYAVGATSAILIPQLHKQSSWSANLKWNASLTCTGSAIGLHVNF